MTFITSSHALRQHSSSGGALKRGGGLLDKAESQLAGRGDVMWQGGAVAARGVRLREYDWTRRWSLWRAALECTEPGSGGRQLASGCGQSRHAGMGAPDEQAVVVDVQKRELVRLLAQYHEDGVQQLQILRA